MDGSQVNNFHGGYNLMMMEVVFEVVEEADGGYIATALGETIVTEADTRDELHQNVREAVLCHFEGREAPKVIRLHYIHQEVIAL